MVRGRGDTDTLDDHKLLWAREGPVHDDIEARLDLPPRRCGELTAVLSVHTTRTYM